jgi:UDP-N-acetylglucosamine 4-epimerase
MTLPQRHRWFVTGVAGFIGSHLLEGLLRKDHCVTGVDNFSAGHRANLDDVRRRVSAEQWARFDMLTADITEPGQFTDRVRGADFVLHHAALGSVPRSIEEPIATHATNVTGFLNVLLAARDAGVRRVVYASSSAVYGDCAELPAVEDRIGRPLSPYAASKAMNEEYAAVFERCYGITSIGLRYFNVFGPRQDPDGAYAAVIPRWIDALLKDRPPEIYGDGETSRDFCHVDNVVEANLIAATAPLNDKAPRVYNVGLGRATSLNELFDLLRRETARFHRPAGDAKARYLDFRTGDVRQSRADIGRIQRELGFRALKEVEAGLSETVEWFARGA